MAGPELNIPISVNLDKFRRGMDEASAQTERAASGIEGVFKNLNPDVSGVFDKFKSGAASGAQDAGNSLGLIIATGMTLALTGVVTGLIATIGHLAKFGDAAEELRLPVNLLQALNVAAAEARVSTETMTKAMEHFATASKKGGDDAEKLDEALTRIGPAFQKAFENAPTQAERLRVVADALKSTDNEAKRAQLSLQVFGTENTRLIGIFANGRDGINGFIERLRELGLTVDDALVKEAQKAKSEINLLSEVMQNKMAPALASVYRAILPLIGPLENLAFLVSKTLGAFHTVDDTKPMEALTAELEALNRRADQFQRMRDDLAKGNTAPADSLRENLRQFIGIDTPVSEEIKGLDDEIAKIQDRIKTIDRLIAERQGKGLKITVEPAAFDRRDPLKSSTESRDRFEGAADSIEKRTAAILAETAAIDLGTEARTRARVAAELETVAKQLNKEAGLGANVVTAEQTKRINEVADAWGRASAAMEQARSPLATFGRESANVSAALNRFAADSLNNLTNEMAAVVTGTTSVKDAFRRMADAIIQDLARIAIRQAITGPLATALFGAFGGGAGLPGTPGSPFFGPLAPGNAAGTDNWRGGPTWVGEQGPELINLPKGAQVIPNSVASKMGGITVQGASISIHAPGADAAGLARVEAAVVRLNSSLESRAVRAFQDARSRRVI